MGEKANPWQRDAQPKRPVGRPKGRRYGVLLTARVSQSEKAAFTIAAGKVGMELSQWLRYVCRKASGLEVVE